MAVRGKNSPGHPAQRLQFRVSNTVILEMAPWDFFKTLALTYAMLGIFIQNL
jgi:hypothetical protein